MKTNTIYTALVAILATVLSVSVSSTASAQSSSRRNTSGGNSSTTQRTSDTKQKAAEVSQPRTANTSTQSRNASTSSTTTTQNRNTSTSARSTTTTQSRNTSTSVDRQATQSRGNSSGVTSGRVSNENVGNIRTENNKPNNLPNNNRPSNNGSVRLDNNRPSNNSNVRPGTSGPRPTYYAGRGGDAATKLPPAPKFDRTNVNRYVGYAPFRDGRSIHRPAPIRAYFDFGYRFSDRPRNYYRYRINGMSMYFWDGTWYWRTNGFYNVHRPPVGTRIPISYISSSLYPVDYESASDVPYNNYYVDSYANFYVQINRYELRVVDAPNGAVLYDMPSDYRELIYNGRVYYVVGNAIFEYVYLNSYSWYFCAVGILR